MTAGPLSNIPFIVFHKFSQIVYAEICLPFILTFLFGKPAVQNGKVVKIPGWARKEPTLKTNFSKTTQFLKNPIGEILDNAFKILPVHSFYQSVNTYLSAGQYA